MGITQKNLCALNGFQLERHRKYHTKMVGRNRRPNFGTKSPRSRLIESRMGDMPYFPLHDSITRIQKVAWVTRRYHVRRRDTRLTRATGSSGQFRLRFVAKEEERPRQAGKVATDIGVSATCQNWQVCSPTVKDTNYVFSTLAGSGKSLRLPNFHYSLNIKP